MRRGRKPEQGQEEGKAGRQEAEKGQDKENGTGRAKGVEKEGEQAPKIKNKRHQKSEKSPTGRPGARKGDEAPARERRRQKGRPGAKKETRRHQGEGVGRREKGRKTRRQAKAHWNCPRRAARGSSDHCAHLRPWFWASWPRVSKSRGGLPDLLCSKIPSGMSTSCLWAVGRRFWNLLPPPFSAPLGSLFASPWFPPPPPRRPGRLTQTARSLSTF